MTGTRDGSAINYSAAVCHLLAAISYDDDVANCCQVNFCCVEYFQIKGTLMMTNELCNIKSCKEKLSD